MVSESLVKRHLIKHPPEKSIFLGGGEMFLGGYLHQFLVLEQNLFFGESMELAGILYSQFG
jgi:hypothetical protein